MPRKSRKCLSGLWPRTPKKSPRSPVAIQNPLETLSRDSPETSQIVPETFWRLFGVPWPEAPGDIFEIFFGISGPEGRARETPVRVRSEKFQNESSPNFSNFRPEFCPEFCSEFSPNCSRGVFVLRFVGNGDQKKFTENPRRFSMQNSQANTEKIFTKCFWRAGTVSKGRAGSQL